MSEFTDKVVIVTGASSGIGAGTAVEYAKHGAKLVLAGRNEQNLHKTEAKCEQQGLSRNKILLVRGDLTVEEDCNTLVDRAVDKFGRIDILINSAGGVLNGNIDKITIENMDFMYKTNVASMFMVTKRAIPHLSKSKGSIVNVASIAGVRPLTNVFAHSVAHAAVIHFSGCLAQDLASRGVNVNCLAPGVIDTEIFLRPGGHVADTPEIYPEFLAKVATIHPLGRVGNVQEVAGTILYLTSQAASFVTGTVIHIDGGRHGSIVNIASIAGVRPHTTSLAYSVAKAAVIQFSGCLAQDLARRGVKVNCLAPGVIDTEVFVRPGGHMADMPEKYPEFLAKVATLHPLGRVGNVQEVAGTILYLTSQAASFVTGTTLIIDGGRHGSIVNIASIAGVRPLTNVFAYSVAKAAVIQFSGCLAQDLASRGVNVNCLAPGVIDTEIFVRPGGHIADTPEKYPEFLAKVATLHPLGRVGNVQEVAGTILYLTSQAASFVTGTVLHIDGGRHGVCPLAKL